MDENSHIQFRKTKRGGRMLSKNGYDYTLKRKNKDESELWRCTHRDSNKCFGTVKYIPHTMTAVSETLHNHEPRAQVQIEIIQQMYLCTQELENNFSKPVTQVFEDNMQILKNKGIDLCQPLPKFENMKKRLYKERNKSIGASKVIFRTATEIKVPKKYEKLLFADYKYGKKRILIFGYKKMIRFLKESKRIFVDGTFEICPKSFTQVYTLHANVGSNEEYINVVPVLYALLPDKKQTTYDILFQIIKSRVPEWEPTHITMDFKISAIQAINCLFPEINVIGCYFHFCRRLWRKAKQLAVLRTKQGQIHVKLCSSLSHLPPHFLDDGWLYVMEESPNCVEVTKFNDYFVKTWLEHPVLSRTWSSFGQLDKTNNVVESWNARIKKYIPKKPNIGQFLHGIEKDSTFFFTKLRKCHSQISKRKTATIENNRRINKIIEELLHEQISVGHCLQKLRI